MFADRAPNAMGQNAEGSDAASGHEQQSYKATVSKAGTNKVK